MARVDRLRIDRKLFDASQVGHQPVKFRRLFFLFIVLTHRSLLLLDLIGLVFCRAWWPIVSGHHATAGNEQLLVFLFGSFRFSFFLLFIGFGFRGFWLAREGL